MKYDVLLYEMEIEPYKDAGEMTKEELKIRYENAKKVSLESVFLDKLKRL